MTKSTTEELLALYDSYQALVLHALDEVIHHTAEIGVLRDLYRTSGGGTAWSRS